MYCSCMLAFLYVCLSMDYSLIQIIKKNYTFESCYALWCATAHMAQYQTQSVYSQQYFSPQSQAYLTSQSCNRCRLYCYIVRNLLALKVPQNFKNESTLNILMAGDCIISQLNLKHFMDSLLQQQDTLSTSDVPSLVPSSLNFLQAAP